MSRYTPSRDGIDRKTVTIRLRISKEQVAEMRRLAKTFNLSSHKDILEMYQNHFTDWLGDLEVEYHAE